MRSLCIRLRSFAKAAATILSAATIQYCPPPSCPSAVSPSRPPCSQPPPSCPSSSWSSLTSPSSSWWPSRDHVRPWARRPWARRPRGPNDRGPRRADGRPWVKRLWANRQWAGRPWARRPRARWPRRMGLAWASLCARWPCGLVRARRPWARRPWAARMSERAHSTPGPGIPSRGSRGYVLFLPRMYYFCRYF